MKRNEMIAIACLVISAILLAAAVVFHNRSAHTPATPALVPPADSGAAA